jgi:hypothetical protein
MNKTKDHNHSKNLKHKSVRYLPVKAWKRYKRLTLLGFPKNYQIVQFPNLPLIIAFISSTLNHYIHGTDSSYFLAIGYLGMTIWAYEELVSGSNLFRRLLGTTYMIILVMRVAHAIH